MSVLIALAWTAAALVVIWIVVSLAVWTIEKLEQREADRRVSEVEP